jgi:glycosyltransferase involved in cell wall biosynthesis
VNGLKEIAGDAALFVDPENVGEISDGIFQILKTPGLQQELSRKGLERSAIFNWEKCARETIRILEEVGSKKGIR